MGEVKFNVRMLAAYMKMSVEDLAEKAGINVMHLRNVAAGRVKMTADDLVKLSAFTGIPVKNIEY